ncbi:MAG: glutamate--tRNA ligase [Nanoarchaeota archaeon]
MDIDKTIWKYALRNAAKFGKTDPGRLVGKLLGEEPSLRADMKHIMPVMKKIVDEVNALSPHEIEERLKEFPEEEKEEKDIFDFVVPKRPVVTAFPPDPSKYPHIGHVKAALLNYLFAKKYNGKFYLRFEDTNPELPRTEYYEQFIHDFSWIGIFPDQVFYASDSVDYLYTMIEKFFAEGHAYVCTCTQERVKMSREKGKPCACRSLAKEENLARFKKMLSGEFKEGDSVVRLKIDLSHQNSTMRDPSVFRTNDHPHPRVGKKHRVWPTYDFQNSVLDGQMGVTYRFRTKEFELRNELHSLIQEWAGFTPTEIFEFGRFNMEGVPSSGRMIRELMQKGELSGWDDPKLHTIAALRRRGFTPEGIRNFLLSTGFTKNETVLTWDDLIMTNKRLIDAKAKRYFLVWDAKELVVRNCPVKDVFLKNHPEHEERTRHMKIDGNFLITAHDLHTIGTLPKGSLVRLMDCINIVKSADGFDYHSEDYLAFRDSPLEKHIIHWLPALGNVQVDVFMPDHELITGFGEPSLDGVETGEVIQFERFGFCRLDKKDESYHFWFTHR